MTQRLKRRLEQLERAANAGDTGAGNRAQALATYLGNKQTATDKKADDRVKVLVGAAILEQVRRNQFQACDLLRVMDEFLVRPGERAAVLGDDGQGSDALRRLIS